MGSWKLGVPQHLTILPQNKITGMEKASKASIHLRKPA